MSEAGALLRRGAGLAAGLADAPPDVSLAARLGGLQAVRLVVAACGTALLAARGELLAPASLLLGGWAAATTLTEVARRAGRRRLPAADLLLLVDAGVMAVVIDATGQERSPLVALVYLHIVVATLLVGGGVGLATGLGHALCLYFAGVVALTRADGTSVSTVGSMHAAGFLLVALGAAACARLQYVATSRGRSELRTLADLGRRLASAATAEDIAEVLATTAVEDFGFERAAALHRTANGWSGCHAGERGSVHVALGGHDPLLDEAIAGEHPHLRRELAPGSSLDHLLPLAEDVIVIGVAGQPDLALAAVWNRRRGRELRVEGLAGLVEAATHAGLAAGNRHLHDQLERLASTDGLTGLVNRRAFELHAAARLGEGTGVVSVAMIDLDHFKQVNDTFGHQTGDDVLRRAAAAVRTVVRPGDVAARYGGEELVVLLPDCAAANARAIAERIRGAIAASGDDPPVTASIGVATAEAGCAIEALLAAADQALYRAKAGGRDRVVASRAPLAAA